MPVNQSEVDANASKYSPLEITDWTTLIEYVSQSLVTIEAPTSRLFQTQYLNRAGDQTVKICVVDEENEEIRIDNKEEFDMNVQVNPLYFTRFKWSFPFSFVVCA